MMKTNIRQIVTVFVTLFIPLGMAAQKKQFTLEDLNYGGNNYYSMIPENRYTAWWGDELIHTEASYCALVDKQTGEEKTLFGISELNRKYMVHDCFRVSTAGAFAMAIELALIPLAKNLLLNSDIHVTAIASANAFNEAPATCAGNVCVKQAFKHPEAQEVVQVLKHLQLSFNSPIHFIPMLGSFARGLLAAVQVKCNVDLDVVRQLYEDYYDDHNFTFITDRQVQLQDVLNTNKCLLQLERIDDKLLITAVIDDVMKGAAGNAVHCMNLLFGLHERVGLLTKPSAL